MSAAEASASEAGVDGTPTVLVNGQPLGGTTITSSVDNLERKIAAG